MGKNLIIKGADFSQNDVREFGEVTPYQGYVVTNPSNAKYGLIDSQSDARLNAVLTKIFIPAGESATIRVNNYDTIITDLNLGYVASPDDKNIANGNTVTDIVLTHHPADDSFRENSGEFLIPNTTENGLYFYINFCYNVIQGPPISVSNKHILISKF